MTERFIEKSIAANVVQRQHGHVLVGTWEKDIAGGTDSVSLRFRTRTHTIQTDAATTTGEAEVGPPADLPDLDIDTSDLTGTVNAGTDPVTGADLSSVSRAGVLQLMKRLYTTEVQAHGDTE